MKYQDLYIRCYTTMEARTGIIDYLSYVTITRRHHGLVNDTPDAVDFRMDPDFSSITNQQLVPTMASQTFPIAAQLANQLA